MKVFTVIGARPQFIKSATVSRIISQRTDILEIILHTGQHYDSNMSEIFFEELEIPIPNYNLNIGSGNHGEQTGQMLRKIEEVLLKELPDVVLVYGDTNSTLAGALAASKLHIPVAHVEAGLRSFNKKMPEEINRIVTDHISDKLFVPTKTAFENLHYEGIDTEKIVNVGDVMYDAALFYGKKADSFSKILDHLRLGSKRFILLTIHRAENTDNKEKLLSIFHVLDEISKSQKIVFPMHPRTRQKLKTFGYNFDKSSINFINPIGYLDMIMLEKHAKMIVTDSGGIQKESYFHKVPCITLREQTEWVELVEKGYNTLVKDFSRLPSILLSELEKNISFDDAHIYGDGKAAEKVIYHL